MASPGILEDRYRRLAGDEDRRVELYVARRRLGFTIDEWLSLPWWQRRVYVEGLNREAEERNRPPGEAGQDRGEAMVNSILGGSLGDVAAQGFKIG